MGHFVFNGRWVPIFRCDMVVKMNITWNTEEKLSMADIKEALKHYKQSDEYHRLRMYDQYYSVDNPNIKAQYIDRKERNKTPNNFVPSAFYKTIVDTMAGFMFSNVQYTSDEENYNEELNSWLYDNNYSIKNMKTGVNSLCYNKGLELCYTLFDGNTVKLKYACLDPLSTILVYDNQIEPQLFCAIRFISAGENSYTIDVIYKDEWQYYKLKNDEMWQYEEPRELFFDECPVIVYRSEIIGENSPFHQVLNYIDALDIVLSGNSDEIQRLVDALLVISKKMKDSELNRMQEMKVLQGMKSDDRAEYLEKNMSPEFRKYVSELLVNEMHKSAHVVDWYGTDSTSGPLSAKAMRTRLFDMDMYSNRIEKIFKEGDEKKIRIYNSMLPFINRGIQPQEVSVNYVRSYPSDFEDIAPILNNLTFVSTRYKLQKLGVDDIEAEIEAIEEEKQKNMENFNFDFESNEE